MNRMTNTRAMLVGLIPVLGAATFALPLVAQDTEGGATEMAVSNPRQAEVGTLYAFGHADGRVVVALPRGHEYPGTEPPSYRAFATDRTTLVEGLGETKDVQDLPNDALNRVVVVTFTPGEQGPQAERLTFPNAKQIRALRGSIESFDPTAKMLTVRDSDGKTVGLELDPALNVEIDSGHGLLTLSDLRKGQDVTVYFSQPQSTEKGQDQAKRAYLIYDWI